MATPSINLKDLDFGQIKNELVTYIKSKSDFSDFDFEGSALSTIIDLLSYNTFYQIIFQNILVNEMFIDSAQKLESLISHAKLQGFVVPGRRSSIAQIRVTDSGTGPIPAYTRFSGRKSNAELKVFYNLEEEALVDNGSGSNQATFTVYEAARFVNGANLPFDVESQSCFIPEENIDFRTIKVEVSEDGGTTFTEYKIQTSAEPTISSNENICFLERREGGYDIMFSGVYDSVNGVFETSDLESSTIVRVTYIVPSGSIGNGASTFSFSGSLPTGINNPEIVSLTGLSSTGTNQPSIDNLKFNIPRIYSAQSRVVTKDDVKAFLIENGFATTFSQITVEGGEERSPEELGKVFFRVQRPQDLPSPGERELAVNLLNEKSISGISYEYDASLSGGS